MSGGATLVSGVALAAAGDASGGALAASLRVVSDGGSNDRASRASFACRCAIVSCSRGEAPACCELLYVAAGGSFGADCSSHRSMSKVDAAAIGSGLR